MLNINKKMLSTLMLCILMLAVISVVGCAREEEARKETPPQEAAGEQEEAAKEEIPPQEATAQFPLTITDATGEEITIDSPVERMVIFSADALEAVRILGAADRVVGVAPWIAEKAMFFPGIRELPGVGSLMSPNIEAILALNPDTVHVFGQWPSPDRLEEKLQGTGITVVRQDFFIPGILQEEVINLGKILGLEAEANDYVAWFNSVVNPIKEKAAAIPEEKRVKALLEWGITADGGFTALGLGSGVHEQVVKSGGINIAEGYVEGYGTEIEMEWILQKNPDVIISVSYEGGYKVDDATILREHYDILHKMPGFAKLKAAQENRVHVISYTIVSGPQLPVAFATIAQLLYPDKFADLDPQAIHQEYIDKFSPDVDFDVRTQGVFIYPQYEN